MLLDLQNLALSPVAAPQDMELAKLMTDTGFAVPLKRGYAWYLDNCLVMNGPEAVYAFAWDD